jgi:hypothetical protein
MNNLSKSKGSMTDINKSQVSSGPRVTSGKQSQKKSQPKDQTLTEKEIQKKVEDYKQKLNAELSRIITEEKSKEAERNKMYDLEQDPEVKKKLEMQISNERTQSSHKVIAMTG